MAAFTGLSNKNVTSFWSYRGLLLISFIYSQFNGWNFNIEPSIHQSFPLIWLSLDQLYTTFQAFRLFNYPLTNCIRSSAFHLDQSFLTLSNAASGRGRSLIMWGLIFIHSFTLTDSKKKLIMLNQNIRVFVLQLNRLLRTLVSVFL